VSLYFLISLDLGWLDLTDSPLGSDRSNRMVVSLQTLPFDCYWRALCWGLKTKMVISDAFEFEEKWKNDGSTN